tara:strand:+ start:180 stop:404 length:225 start_codon:yes stop_codon:yes gene_type:complete
MSKKKSYMDKENIINEGIIDKIFDYIKKRKIRKLEKAFRDQPEIKAKIRKFNDDARAFEKYLKSRGIDHKIHKL